MKIIIWGRSSDDTNNALKQKVQSLGPPLILLEGEAKKQESLTEASLIINHDGGFKKPEGAWQINTAGGNMSSIPPVGIQNHGTINWNIFVENLEGFFQIIKGKVEITKEDIEALYAIDPKIEGLLEKLSEAVPFEDLWDSTLRNIKHDLQTEIKRKLV